MRTKDLTYELLQASKMSAERSDRKMLVFLIEMALLEAELSMPSTLDIKRSHPMHIPQIPRPGSARTNLGPA
jgi:hypothetical protein